MSPFLRVEGLNCERKCARLSKINKCECEFERKDCVCVYVRVRVSVSMRVKYRCGKYSTGPMEWGE